MSTPALTVQQPRHLALPDACLVTPSQLSIPRSISKEEFLAVAAKLKALGQAEDFWLADAASSSKKWDDGLQLMAETVGRTKYHLVRVAQIAERFTPANRFSYTVAHLRALMPFPDEFLDSFLPSAANLNLSVKALRARAETEFGSNPYKPQQPKKRSVPLRASLVAQLSERAPRKVSALVERICDEWLSKSPEQQASVLAGEELQKEQKKQKAKEPEAPGTADVRYQLKLYEAAQKAAAKAKSAVVGDTESDGNEPAATSRHPETSATPETPKRVEVDLSEPEPQTQRSPQEYLDAEDGIHRLTDRPTYSQRRAEAIANGAEPISKRVGKRTVRIKPRALRLQWVPCGRQVDAGNGPAMARVRTQKPDCFPTEEAARAAEEKNFQEKGHREEVVYCVVPCGAYHVKHIYSSEVQKKSLA